MNTREMLRHPSGFLPLLMSLAALSIVLVYLAVNGPARQSDEGTAAHIWQLLMAAQVPIVFYFAIKWLPQSPRQGATRGGGNARGGGPGSPAGPPPAWRCGWSLD